MASIFTKIINREIPAYIIAETDTLIAILDAFPVSEGHSLIIPKKEVSKFYELDKDTAQELFILSQKVAKAIEKVIPCQRVGLAVVGLEVPHTHLHLLPLNGPEDMNLNKKTLSLSKEDMENILQKIKSQL